jgi:hypothetical protein
VSKVSFAIDLLRPRELWHWIALGFAGLLVLLLLSFYATGDTDLQNLRNDGRDDVVDISQVLEHDAAGHPTKVVAGGTVLDDLAGSVDGNTVHVRTAGDITWSRTKYESASLVQGILLAMLVPPLLAFALIVIGNIRYARRPFTDLTWHATDQP